MKYKTLFRLALKLVGVVTVLVAAGGVIGSLTTLISYLVFESRSLLSSLWLYFLPNLVASIAGLAVGLYLFFGGKWIVDLAVPGNRPYCPECGYDLSGTTGDLCAECGTRFRGDPLQQSP